jgi:hypothetical protein
MATVIRCAIGTVTHFFECTFDACEPVEIAADERAIKFKQR